MEETFWRLLSDFERLTQDEAVALRERNFPYLNRVQESKQDILPKLCELSAELGLSTADPRLKPRIEKVMAAVQENARLAAVFLEENAFERTRAEHALRRLGGVRKTYGPPGIARTSYAA